MGEGPSTSPLPEGEGQGEGAWVEAHPLIFPVMVRSGSGFRQELQFRVPLDDTHTWNLHYQCFVPGNGVKAPKQDVIPLFEIPLKDESGEYIFNVAGVRDMVLWVSQGDMLDRTREHLSEGDRGVELYRRMLQQQVAIVEDGGDPINTFRVTAEVGGGLDLKPAGDEAALPGRPFDPAAVDRDVERYSPDINQVKRLYRRMERAAEKPAGAEAPRPAARARPPAKKGP
jgi:5,5'-dehydrodivanillate O-demethylase oxygenase subunit